MSTKIEEIYYDLHQNPELSYKEYNTTKYILDYLENYNLIIKKLDPTGLIAIINNNSDDTIAFRTDIDALPINEENNLEYKSKNKNVMHACGHDGHMSILLKFIDNIYSKKLKFNKNIMFIFQPAEEVDGGAQIVLEDDFFKSYNITNIFGIHLWPELASSKIGFKNEEMMGTNKVFEIKIHGKSAHVCTPQKGIDSTIVLKDIIDSINYLIAKSKNPFEPVVINIGQINGGSAPNIIIGDLVINGTIRASNDSSLKQISNKFLNILKALEIKYDVKIEFIQKEITYPAVYNDIHSTNLIIDKLMENNIEFEILKNPTLACEDFGFYSQKFATNFFFLGTYDKLHPNMLHTNNFSFDVSILNKGVELYELLLQYFGQ